MGELARLKKAPLADRSSVTSVRLHDAKPLGDCAINRIFADCNAPPKNAFASGVKFSQWGCGSSYAEAYPKLSKRKCRKSRSAPVLPENHGNIAGSGDFRAPVVSHNQVDAPKAWLRPVNGSNEAWKPEHNLEVTKFRYTDGALKSEAQRSFGSSGASGKRPPPTERLGMALDAPFSAVHLGLMGVGSGKTHLSDLVRT